MKRLGLVLLGLALLSQSFSNLTLMSFAQVPADYLPNSHINTSWNSILNTLTELQAYRKTGNEVPASMFRSLNSNFKVAFKYFPNNPSYNVIYRQCDITTAQLSTEVKYDDYNTFVSKCFDPLSAILKDIQNNFTVVSVLKANPRVGQAPLSVTLDASASTDPSNETIPSNNFFWYYTNTAGQDVIIGKGPIINHTFATPGNYVIHSTVRSINNLNGYFDADNTITVAVQPTDTKINILANGFKLDENNPTKLSLSEGVSGITFDATTTTISQGKRIAKYSWNITSSDGTYNKTSNGDGVPGTLSMQLDRKGSYKVTLTVTDNTAITTSKVYQLILSDPVSKIRANPQAGTTSTQFAFDGDSSYSVSNKVNLYRWDVYDVDSGLLTTSQEKNLRYQFQKPGIYTVKLTITDQQGFTDSSQIKVNVESTPPVAQFTMEPTSEWLDPSQFIFDASSSFDYDMLNNNDSLTFERGFSDPDNTTVVEQAEGSKQVQVQFNTNGTHKVKLKVTDSFGKIAELTKDVVINSSLRPVIHIDPVAAPWGTSIEFNASANKEIISYIWSFGDGKSRTVQSKSVSHIFEKVGVYKVTLTATSREGDKNTVSTMVYIGENSAPIGVYNVLGPNNQLLLPTDECNGESAYSITRYQQMTIDSSQSVDIKGQKANIKTLFKPQNDDVFTTSQFRYKFGELGCQFVDMVVEDQEELTTDKKTIWFKVKNGLPSLNTIYLSFPQYSNDVGIGLFQYNAPKDPNFEQFDPLVVRVNMNNPVDLDGSISYIAWYYYKPEDPDRLLDIKITPGNSNAVNFAISREAGEYTFGAKLIDNDGGEVASEDIIGKGPSIFIKPKGNDSIDIPLVTIKSDAVSTKVGEEVTFTVSSKILSNRSDFKANRIIKYDFDGDGIDDLTTKDDIIKYIYTTPSPDGKPYKAKVKVIYREKVGVGYTEPIIVKKALKPNFILASYDKKILIRDTSYGLDDKTTFEYCLDKNDCENTTIKGEKTFLHEYKEYGTYTIVLTATDQYSNTVTTEKKITLSPPATRLFISLMSTPDNRQTTNGFELDVGKSLNNQVILYPQYFGTGECYMDINLSNGDDDKDKMCNQLHTIDIKSVASQVYYKLWYSNAKGLTSKIIKVNLLDNQTIVPEQYKQTAAKMSELIEKYSNKEDYITLVSILQNLAQNLGDKEKTTEYLIDLSTEMQTTTYPETTQVEIKDITDSLANAGFRATQGLSEYERVKADILAYANPSLEPKISSLFDKLENTSDKTDMYNQLAEVLRLYGLEVTAGTVEQDDFTSIKELICKIVMIKEIPGSKCVTTGEGAVIIPDETIVEPDTTTSNTGGSSIVKWILWIIGLAVGLFLLAIIIFAVRARISRAKIANEQGEAPSTPNPAPAPNPPKPSQSENSSSNTPPNTQTPPPSNISNANSESSSSSKPTT